MSIRKVSKEFYSTQNTMYLYSRFGLLLFVLLCNSCTEKSDIKFVSTGYNNLIFLSESQNQDLKNESIPPPPNQNILPTTFFEHREQLYFYQLKIKPRLCGYMVGDANYEYYSEDLKLLGKKDILLVNDTNLDSIISNAILKQKPINRCIAIGIPDSISKNEMISKLLNRLLPYRNTTSWKVRGILQQESALGDMETERK